MRLHNILFFAGFAVLIIGLILLFSDSAPCGFETWQQLAACVVESAKRIIRDFLIMLAGVLLIDMSVYAEWAEERTR